MTLFSLTHILYLLGCAIVCTSLYFILKNKSEKTKKATLLAIMFASLVIHFLKLFTPKYYNDLPQSLRSITPESLCAISTLIFPFIFISKNKALRDYMVVFGTLSGIATLLIPGDLLGTPVNDIEITRFFFAHLVIFMCPFLTYVFNIHRPSKKWLLNNILIIFIMLNVIALDHVVFTYITQGKEGLNNYLTPLVQSIHFSN